MNDVAFNKNGSLNIIRGKNKIDITDNGIAIQDSNGNKVEMSSSGVTLQGKSGKVEIV